MVNAMLESITNTSLSLTGPKLRLPISTLVCMYVHTIYVCMYVCMYVNSNDFSGYTFIKALLYVFVSIEFVCRLTCLIHYLCSWI